MDCGTLCAPLVETLESTLVLIVATLYRILMFMVYLSASIGPSVLISRVYAYCTGQEPLSDLAESAICMLFVSCWAEFSVVLERKLFGDILEKYKAMFPTTMTFGRFTVHFILYLSAYCQLYGQFELSHTFPSPPENPKQSRTHHRNHGANNENYLEKRTSSTSSSTTENYQSPSFFFEPGTDYHNAEFQLALAYLVFCTAKNLHKDALYVVRDFPYPSLSVLNNCVIRIGFAVIHFAVNTLYFLPVLAIAYTTRSYKYSGNLTYFQLTFAAALCGMIAAVFEMNKPWPRERGRMPFLYLENNMIGKQILAHVLILVILISYYRPFSHDKVSDKLFDSSNPDVIFFSLCVAFTTLHVIKYGVHAILSMAGDYDLNRPEDNIDMVDLVGGGGGSNHRGAEPNRGGEESGGEIPVRCARCMASEAASTEDNQNNNLPICPRHGGTPPVPETQQVEDERGTRTQTNLEHLQEVLDRLIKQGKAISMRLQASDRERSENNENSPSPEEHIISNSIEFSNETVYKPTTAPLEDGNNNLPKTESS